MIIQKLSLMPQPTLTSQYNRKLADYFVAHKRHAHRIFQCACVCVWGGECRQAVDPEAIYNLRLILKTM